MRLYLVSIYIPWVHNIYNIYNFILQTYYVWTFKYLGQTFTLYNVHLLGVGTYINKIAVFMVLLTNYPLVAKNSHFLVGCYEVNFTLFLIYYGNIMTNFQLRNVD